MLPLISVSLLCSLGGRGEKGDCKPGDFKSKQKTGLNFCCCGVLLAHGSCVTPGVGLQGDISLQCVSWGDTYTSLEEQSRGTA